MSAKTPRSIRAADPSEAVQRQDLRDVPNQEAPDAAPEWWTSDDWATPSDVFARISERYGPFDMDPCCRTETRKAEMFYTKADDGLSRPWIGVVYVNPPYSDPGPWIQKAIEEVKAGRAERVVMLLAAAIDTGWYHRLVVPHADVVPVRGRIRFLGWKGTPIGSPKAGNVIAIIPKRPAETFDARVTAGRKRQLRNAEAAAVEHASVGGRAQREFSSCSFSCQRVDEGTRGAIGEDE